MGCVACRILHVLCARLAGALTPCGITCGMQLTTGHRLRGVTRSMQEHANMQSWHEACRMTCGMQHCRDIWQHDTWHATCSYNMTLQDTNATHSTDGMHDNPYGIPHATRLMDVQRCNQHDTRTCRCSIRCSTSTCTPLQTSIRPRRSAHCTQHSLHRSPPVPKPRPAASSTRVPHRRLKTA